MSPQDFLRFGIEHPLLCWLLATVALFVSMSAIVHQIKKIPPGAPADTGLLPGLDTLIEISKGGDWMVTLAAFISFEIGMVLLVLPLAKPGF